jgi:hypothetical protein
MKNEKWKTKLIIVSFAMASQAMYHKIHRNPKHISIIAYMSIGKESIILYIIASRNSEFFCSHLKKSCIRIVVDCISKSKQLSCVNAKIVKDDVTYVFAP